MPPCQIDRTVGVTKFKNDESLSDGELDTIVKWVDAGAPQGDPKDMPPAREWPSDQGWNFAAIFGQNEPDLVVKSDVVHDAGRGRRTRGTSASPRRASPSRAGCAPSRSGPMTVKGRKITHHAIAYLRAGRARRHGRRPACPRRSWNGRSASRAS